jgi:hypothetical protein
MENPQKHAKNPKKRLQNHRILNSGPRELQN